MLRRRSRHRHDHPAGLNRFAHRSRLRAGLCLIAVAAALAVGACGDDENSAESAISKKAFVAKAERICLESATALKVELTKEFGRAKISKAELVAFTESSAIPNIERQLEQLRALPQPAGDIATLDRYYSEYERGIEQLKQDPSIVNQPELPSPFKKANALATSFGIGDCVR